MLVFIPSLGAYLAPDLLGGGKTAYVGNLIQSQFAVARDMPFGAALSFVLSLVVAALLAAVPPPAREGAGALGGVAGPASARVAGWGSLTALVYLSCTRRSWCWRRCRSTPAGCPASWEGFTLDWYLRAAANPAILASLRNSLLVGSRRRRLSRPSLATAAALAFHRHRFRRRRRSRRC